MDAVNNKEEKTLHTMNYVTQTFIKHGKVQKTIENTCQVTQQSEVTSEADNKLESHFTDNESLPYNTVDDCVKTSFMERSNVPDSDLIETRKTSSKRKRKESTKQAKRVPKREEKEEVR